MNTKKLLKTVTLLAAFSLLTVSCSQENVEVSVGIDTSADPAVSPIELSLDGIWQAMGSASWNLEGHTASKTPVTRVLGALGGIPAGMSVVEGGVIPYLPAALEQRNANLESWNDKDSDTK